MFRLYLECVWWGLDTESLPGLLLHDDVEGDSSVSNTKWFQTCINNTHVLSPVMEWWIALSVIDLPTRGGGWNSPYCPWILTLVLPLPQLCFPMGMGFSSPVWMPGFGLDIERDDGDTQIELILTIVSSACTCLTHGDLVPPKCDFCTISSAAAQSSA